MKVTLKNWWAVIEDPKNRPDVVLVSEKEPRPLTADGKVVAFYASAEDKGDWYYVGIGLLSGGIPYEETEVSPEFRNKFLTPKKITINIEIEENN